MGYTVGEKHFRANRKTRSVKSDADHGNNGDKASVPTSGLESSIRSLNFQIGANGSPQNINISSNPNMDEAGCGYCTEEQLEEILLKNLEFLYNEAISKLVSLGYDEEFSLNTILRSGHSYGQSDVLTNIMQNSLSYLNDNEVSDDNSPSFSDLKQLVEYSLAALVCFLQRVKPHLSKGDAMWCLLMSELHLTRASALDFPALPTSSNNTVSMSSSINPPGISPDSCKFHGGWGFGHGGTSEFPSTEVFSYTSEMTLQREIECPKRYNLTPSMRSLLKKNVALFAAGFRANSKQVQKQSQISFTSVTVTGLDPIAEIPSEHKNNKDFHVARSHEVANAVLSKFREMSLDGVIECEDQKDEVILKLIRQITDLEKQVKERREWAHQKAIQAAKKLSNDLAELKMLRVEKEETQRLKKGKQPLEDSTMKRLSEMENALRKASGQVDRANAGVRRLEHESAEIRAEMEAAKLSASESVNACLEVAKREKKFLKKLLAWEKQKTKLQDEISAEKLKVSEVQKELVQIEESQMKAEEKWRKEQKAREVAEAQVEKERHLKEETEANTKRKLEAVRLKIEIDFQRHKDDVQRLEQELSRLKAASATNHEHQPKNSLAPPKGLETITRLLNKLDASLDKNGGEICNTDRKCIICKKEEVSVVFLPCTHQILCSSCNDSHGKKEKASCPSCRLPIEQRIRVFGAAS